MKTDVSPYGRGTVLKGPEECLSDRQILEEALQAGVGLGSAQP